MTGDPKPKVVVITGPTAVGKTELSLSLAERLQGEIISADSVQVYRGLDVGSAKVSIMDQGWLEPVRSSATLASISANDCDSTWQPRIDSFRCRPMGQCRLSASEWMAFLPKKVLEFNLQHACRYHWRNAEASHITCWTYLIQKKTSQLGSSSRDPEQQSTTFSRYTLVSRGHVFQLASHIAIQNKFSIRDLGKDAM